jgi:hypothetical protein
LSNVEVVGELKSSHVCSIKSATDIPSGIAESRVNLQFHTIFTEKICCSAFAGNWILTFGGRKKQNYEKEYISHKIIYFRGSFPLNWPVLITLISILFNSSHADMFSS